VTLSVHGPSPARSLALDECLALGARTFLPVRGDRPTRLRPNSSLSSGDGKQAAVPQNRYRSHESTKDTKRTGAECQKSVSFRFRDFVAIYFGFRAPRWA